LRDGVAADDPKQEFAEILIREVDRLNRVLEDFLRFARPEPVEQGRFVLQHVIGDVLDLTRQQAARNNVDVAVDLGDEIGIRGQGEQLKQAFLNLVLNALQAMPNGGALKISMRALPQEVQVLVSDSGPGIAPEDRERIFNPFVTTRDSGTGLGLAITQRIIQGHGGRIILDSRPGEGACFTVCLPRPQKEMEPVES